MTQATTSTERFGNRVADYVKYRPTYPAAAIDFICTELVLTQDSAIADLGSGTGISALPFLQRGITVLCIEPNAQMRAAQESYLAGYDTMRSVDGTAEHTTLPDQAIDHAIAAQAFHWFDRPNVARELHRVLRPGGKLALLWNERLTETTSFLREYENILQTYGTDYATVDHRNISREVLTEFFGPQFIEQEFSNVQHVDLDGLLGRARSSSYLPSEGEPRFDEMIAALKALFGSHEHDGFVNLEYTCKIYIGKPALTHSH